MDNNRNNSHRRWKSFIAWHTLAAMCFLKQTAYADELGNFYQLNNFENPLTESLNGFKESSRDLQKPQFAKLILAKQNAKASKMDILKNEYYLVDQYIPPYFSSANPKFLFDSQLSSVSQEILSIDLSSIVIVPSVFKSFEAIIYTRLPQVEMVLEYIKKEFNYQSEFFASSREFGDDFPSDAGASAKDYVSDNCNIPDGFAKPAICFLIKEWQQAYEEFASSPFTFRGMTGDRIDEFAEFFEAAWGWANSWFNFDHN